MIFYVEQVFIIEFVLGITIIITNFTTYKISNLQKAAIKARDLVIYFNFFAYSIVLVNKNS